MSDAINHNLTFISSFLCLCPVSAPLNPFPLGRCRHGQIVHRKELRALFFGFLQLLFFFNPSPSPVESCITKKKSGIYAWVCVLTTPKVLDSSSPALKSERGWAPSLSPAALLSLPSWQRGGEDTQGVGQKTEANSFICSSFPAHALFLRSVSFV